MDITQQRLYEEIWSLVKPGRCYHMRLRDDEDHFIILIDGRELGKIHLLGDSNYTTYRAEMFDCFKWCDSFSEAIKWIL